MLVRYEGHYVDCTRLQLRNVCASYWIATRNDSQTTRQTVILKDSTDELVPQKSGTWNGKSRLTCNAAQSEVLRSLKYCLRAHTTVIDIIRIVAWKRGS